MLEENNHNGFVGQVSIWKSATGKTLWSVKVPALGTEDVREKMFHAMELALEQFAALESRLGS